MWNPAEEAFFKKSGLDEPPRNSFERTRNTYESEAAYAKATRLLRASRIDMQDKRFLSHFCATPEGKERYLRIHRSTKEDLERFQAQKKGQAPEDVHMRKLGVIEEGAILSTVNTGGLLSTEARAYKSSYYDDYKKGVDIVVEMPIGLPGEGKKLYFGLDATLSGQVGAKFNRAKIEVETGKGAEVAFLPLAEGEPYQGGREMTRLIVGMDTTRLSRMMQGWQGEHITPDLLDRIGADELLLEEMRLQLGAYEELARARGKNELAERLGTELGAIESIMRFKKLDGLGEELRKDVVFSGIEEHAGRIREAAKQRTH